MPWFQGNFVGIDAAHFVDIHLCQLWCAVVWRTVSHFAHEHKKLPIYQKNLEFADWPDAMIRPYQADPNVLAYLCVVFL